MIVGKLSKINLKIIFQLSMKINFVLHFLSSGLFGSSISNYNEMYQKYLSNNICEFFVNNEENLYLPG